MKLPKYLLCFATGELEQQLIIQTGKPHVISSVWLFNSEDSFASFISSYSGIAYSTIDGYRVVLTYLGTFDRLVVNQSTIPQVRSILDEMAEFYKTERILKKTGFYQKYLR